MGREFKFCPFCKAKLKRKKIIQRYRLYCKRCKWICYENPLPAVASIIIKDKKVLLIKRKNSPQKGKWALPSGFVEIDETPEDSCLRELKEETGLKGSIERLIGVFRQRGTVYKAVLVIGYLVKAKGKLKPGDDAEEIRLFNIDELPKVPFDSHRKLIKMVIH